MMTLTVNGEQTQTSTDQTVQGLVSELGLMGRPLAVEVNQTLVPRKEHAQASLHDGDVIEIVTLVGGG